MNNFVFLKGNWAKDPDLRYTENGRPFALCTLAVDRPVGQNGEEKVADFIPVIIGGDLAETVAGQTSKGSAVWVTGALRVRTYQDASGNKHTAMNVNAFQVGLVLTGKRRNEQNGMNRTAATRNGAQRRALAPASPEPWPASTPSLDDILGGEGDFNEDDLPF